MRKAEINILITLVLVIVAIALAIGFFIYGQKFIKGDVVDARLTLLNNKYINNNQVITVSLQLTSKTDKLLKIVKITPSITYADGTVNQGDLTVTLDSEGTFSFNGDRVGSDVVYGRGVGQIEAGKTANILITFRHLDINNPVQSISIRLTFEDDKGHTYTVTTNSIELE
ncbi:hypothetical protein [Pyrococcus abyssi]|nr:hypothetical protein [Pyrococcus abyssi]